MVKLSRWLPGWGEHWALAMEGSTWERTTVPLIWLAIKADPAREAPSTLLRPQRWEQSLTDIHHPLPGDSLIPMFEGMVDRAPPDCRQRRRLRPRIPTGKAAAARAGSPSGRVRASPRSRGESSQELRG